MEQQVLEVEQRVGKGKGDARKLRASGKIPGVLYGHKEQPTPLSLDPHQLRKRIRASDLGRNTVLQLSGLDRSVMALIKDTQIDPVRRDLIHVDFFEVRETDRVVVEVPLEFEGKAAGVVLGGELQIVRRSLPVRCSPMQIPKSLTVSVTQLGLGQSLHISDVALPEGTECGTDPKLAICTIKAPRTEATPGQGAEGAAAS